MVSLKDARYQVLKNLFGPLVAEMACPTEIVGEGHIPSRGAALLVCNHRSVMDPYIFSARTKRVVNWVMAPFVSSIPVFGWLAEQAGAISIIKGEERKAQTLIDDMVRVMRQGRLVGIFPEGMANFAAPVGPLELATFRGTFVRAALTAKIPNLPVIPAAIYAVGETSLGEVSGSLLQLFDPGERTFERSSMHLLGYQKALIVIGKPVTLDAYYERYVALPPGQEPLEQARLVEELAERFRGNVNQLLQRAALLESPTDPELLPTSGI